MTLTPGDPPADPPGDPPANPTVPPSKLEAALGPPLPPLPPPGTVKRAPWPLVAWRIFWRLAYYGFVVWLAWRAIPAIFLLLVLCPVLAFEWFANRNRKRGYTPG